MRRKLPIFAVALTAGASLALAQDAPPVPQPVVPPLPPPPVTQTEPAPLPMPLPLPLPLPAPAPAEAVATPGVIINLREPSETIAPGKSCDGLADPEAAAIAVEADGGDLTADLTGLTAAHCFIGGHSAAVLMFELTQPLDIAPEAPGVSGAEVTLAARLDGYLWARHKAQAAVKLADVAVYDAAGTLVLSIAMPPAMVADGSLRYQQEATAPVTFLPIGRYTLVAHFTIESGAGGLVRAHGTAQFGADDPPGLWVQSGDPFAEVAKDDFGFHISLSAAAIAPAASQARHPGAVQAASYRRVQPLGR